MHTSSGTRSLGISIPLFEFSKRLLTILAFSFLLTTQFSLAQVETDVSSGGAIRIGDSTTPCAPSIDGSLRYDADGTFTVDYCNGSNWISLLTSTYGGAVVNNGNSFTAPMIIGTNDANNLSFETNGTTRMTIDTSGNLGVGTTSPSFPFHLYSPSSSLILIQDQNNSSGQAPAFLGMSARDSAGSPDALDNGDVISVFGGRGRGTSTWSVASVASVQMLAEEDFTDSAMGAGIDFQTTATGTTSRTSKMMIKGNGNVGIGTATPTQTLHVHGKVAVTGSGTPTLSACGTGGTPTVTGNDTRGTVTFANGNPSACTVTFSSAFSSTPVCVVTSNHTAAGISTAITAISTTAFTLAISAGTNGFKFNYICLQ